MTNLKNIWEKSLLVIEKGVSQGTFSAFFKTSELLSLENNTATIGIANAMAINMIKGKHLNLVKEALDTYTGLDTKVLLVPHVQAPHSSADDSGPLFQTGPKSFTPPMRNLQGIRDDFTFENLAVSESNRLAYESAQHVAKNLGKFYNPFYIFGPVGVGKTHMMQAIANEVYKHKPMIKVIYVTSEEFTNEIVQAITKKTTANMRERFRKVNLLIIDDIQFFSNKKVVQEELFHTFNALITHQAQIVLSSDKPPSEIQGLEDRLSSRFAGGLTVDIQAPDFEMRTAIILKKADKLGIRLAIESAKVLAQKQQDARSLEGTLLRAVTEARAKGIDINNLILEKHIPQQTEGASSKLHSDDVIKLICEYFNVKPTALKGEKRNASIVKARQVAMYILKYELHMTLNEIGNLLGGRDHTTIIHGVEKMELSMLKSMPPSEDIVGITKMLRG